MFEILGKLCKKTELFPKKPIDKISSTLDSNNTGGTAYRVWYHSDNFNAL